MRVGDTEKVSRSLKTCRSFFIRCRENTDNVSKADSDRWRLISPLRVRQTLCRHTGDKSNPIENNSFKQTVFGGEIQIQILQKLRTHGLYDLFFDVFRAP